MCGHKQKLFIHFDVYAAHFRHPFVAIPHGRTIPALMTEGYTVSPYIPIARASPGHGREGERPSGEEHGIHARGEEGVTKGPDKGEAPDLAALVMGNTSSKTPLTVGKQRSGGTRTESAPDSERDASEEVVDFSTQPPLFKVRGLLGLPPLRALGGQEVLPLMRFSSQQHERGLL